jgi:hypothetical protein
VAPRYTTWVYRLTFVETAGTNPARGMDVFVRSEVCVVSSRGLCDVPNTRPGILPSVVRLSVIEEVHTGGLANEDCRTTRKKYK